jgi:ketosteroid isomerase-like protein
VEVDSTQYARFLLWEEQEKKQALQLAAVMGALAAEGERNADAFFASFHPDARFWINGDTGASGTRRGLAEMKSLFDVFMAQLPAGFSQTIVNAYVTGDRVVTETLGRATTLAGQTYTGTYCQVWKFEKAHIVELAVYLDTKLLDETFPAECWTA